MGGAKSRRRDHLRLVEPTHPAELPLILTDPAARSEFERLTQRLVDIAIEVMDVADGDPDLELGDDEFEESDGI